jgi:hypothetical protein
MIELEMDKDGSYIAPVEKTDEAARDEESYS